MDNKTLINHCISVSVKLYENEWYNYYALKFFLAFKTFIVFRIKKKTKNL